jgi:ABC-type lipoprotein release transport system permease subunit
MDRRAHRQAGARSGWCHPVTAVWLFLRAEFRRRWRPWLSLALIVGVFAGGVVTAAAGALRTDSAYARLLDWSRAPDVIVDAEPYDPDLARLPPGVVMGVPQAVDAVTIKAFGVAPDIIELFAPASDAVPGSFWKRKILSGRLADPHRPGEVNVSFTLAQRLHLRPGGSLRVVLTTADGKPEPFVFHVAGIDAAQLEFPPQPGNGTYIAWATPAFYRQHQSLSGFTQVVLRLRHGTADWPAVQRELGEHTGGKVVEASLPSDQSVNTQRSIRPQAVALWLLAALSGVIGLLIAGQLLARLSFLEAAGYGTLRALGMTRGQLMAACLGRAAAIGAAGGLIGAMLGVALSPLLPVGLARVAEPHPGIDVNTSVLAVGLAAAIVVTAGCAAWPGWRAATEGPLTRPSPSPRRGAGFRLAAVRPVSLGMGMRLALHRGAGRTAVPVRSAIASATVGVSALIATIVFAASLSHLLASPALYGVTWDAIASNAAANDVRPIVDTIRHDRQVAAWTICWTGAPLQAGHTAFEAIALPLPGDAPFISAPVTGRLPRTGREIALGTKTLQELHARIGTTIEVSVESAPARPMTVVGTTVFPSLSDKLGLGTGAALTPDALHYLVPAQTAVPPPGDVLIRFRPGISPQAGRQALAAQLARRGSFTVDGPATPTDLVNFGQVQRLPQALGAGLAAVALLTIAHVLMTSVRRRQRDVAILRALGFTPGQIRRMFGWQAVTLAGIALVIGIPVGIAAGRLCWQVFAHQLGIAPVIAVPLAALPVMAASWLAAATAIAALPSGAATRSPPAQTLHTE